MGVTQRSKDDLCQCFGDFKMKEICLFSIAVETEATICSLILMFNFHFSS